jgi:hypothetical protein
MKMSRCNRDKNDTIGKLDNIIVNIETKISKKAITSNKMEVNRDGMDTTDNIKGEASPYIDLENDEPDIEVWVDLKKGVEDRPILMGMYQISNMGRVRNSRTMKVLQNSLPNDYIAVTIGPDYKHRYSYYIHVLVAYAFVVNDNPLEFDEVDHIDQNRRNNIASNLRWIHHKGNCQAYQVVKEQKYNPILQYSFTGELIKEWHNFRSIMKENPSYNESTMYHCLSGLYKTANGFIWKYKFPPPPEIIQPDEVFKNIGTYDGCDYSGYMVSNYGQIRSLYKNKLLTPKTQGGYRRLGLLDKNTGDIYQELVHRMVASAFVDGRTTERNYVNHMDRNRKNNYSSNLEWVTQQENMEHAVAIKVNQIDIKTGKILNTFKSIITAGRYLDPHNAHARASGISSCCREEHLSSCGFIWEYASDDQEVSKEIIPLESLKSNPGEEWINVKGYEDQYEISNQGRVWSKRFKIFMAPHMRQGMPYVILRNGDQIKMVAISRLVAIHFLKNPNNYRLVLFKDGNYRNSVVDNLYWGKKLDSKPSATPDVLETPRILPGEIWKDMKGYENLYEISNKGRVWSKKYQIYMTLFLDKERYSVHLHDGKKGRIAYIGRLLAINFIPNPNNFKCVKPKDGNLQNTSLDNLYWVPPTNWKPSKSK